ncbi:uncharacterized protein EDB91DRAFT_1235971 [Suillus paluster]|uniref:uncharacterized protein n=1 Tax=Suillus paluster TaxID=48578 RepID=UPI001B85FFA9|nr:uncharacterized protein EDB91DRAFT_1235971 [Suillus paluster]KAG1747246.1 hypothetical protein EDB91DRAFT_1235971 [Suillus paluster]
MAIPEWTIPDFIHQEPWWKNRGLLVLNICLILPLLSSALNGLDSSILPGWQEYFHTPQGKTLGLINSAQGIGALSGIPFSPLSTVFIGATIMLAGVLTQALSTTVQMFIGARVLIGLGLAFSINAAPLLISEVSYPTHVCQITSSFIWFLTCIAAAWICVGAYNQAGASEWSWRVPVLFQAVVPVIQMVLIWFIPESPRFLVAKGLESQAAHILAHYHADGGDEHDHLVAFEMAQIRHALNLEREITFKSSYLTCFATPGNRRRMFIIISIAIFSQWSGNGLVSAYINIVLEGLFNFSSALLGTMLVDKLGRRKLFLISNIGMLIVFSMWTVTTALFTQSGNIAAASATVSLIFMFFFFYDFAYTPMLVSYTLEILPYNIRAKGLAIMNFSAYLTNALTCSSIRGRSTPWYLVYCGWLALELLFVMVFIVETRGRTLEETAALFDGVKLPRHVTERRGEAAVDLSSISPYLRSPRLEKDGPDNYLELQGRSGVRSSVLGSHSRLESQSEESAIAFR